MQKSEGFYKLHKLYIVWLNCKNNSLTSNYEK